jgi:hypothetical protein
VDKVDEGCRTISWPEWYDSVCPFDRVNPLECQLLLARTVHRELMIAHWRVEHPPPFTTAKFVEYRRITSGDGICDDASYAVEWDVVDTEAPNKVFDVADVLLVELGCK